jgi:uncharacterized protein (DUF488 family)
MDLVLDKQKSSRRHKSPLQKRFERLRDTIERQRRFDARFRNDLDELVETYKRLSMENDRSVFDELVELSR